MQFSTLSVNMPKKTTYLESYMDFGSTSSKQMMFKNHSVSFSPQCLVMVRGSRQFCKLASLHPHICTWQPHVLADNLRSISCGRNSAYIRVRFWRCARIGSTLSRCFCNRKRKETACNWRV